MYYFQKTHYEQGKTNLEKARNQKLLGNLNGARKSFRHAVEEFEKALTKNPDAVNIKIDLSHASLERGDVFKDLRLMRKARDSYNKAKLLGHSQADNRLAALALSPTITPSGSASTLASSTSSIKFFQDPPLLSEKYLPLQEDTLPIDTRHLAHCLQQDNLSNQQKSRLQNLASWLIKEFINNPLKTPPVITEVVNLAIILDEKTYRLLLEEFLHPLKEASLLQIDLLAGLAQLIRNASKGFLGTDDLIRILEILYSRLQETKDVVQLIPLIKVTSHVLDAMSDNKVGGLSREKLHTPLYRFLRDLSKNESPLLAYQATYSCQALLSIPDDETAWQSFMRQGLAVTKGTLTLASAIKSCDLTKLLDVFENFKEAYDGIDKLLKSGQNFVEDVKDVDVRDVMDAMHSIAKWYVALRLTDVLLQSNELVKFEQAVHNMSCRTKPEFLIGICQRLEELANSHPDIQTQRNALLLLEDFYQNNEDWKATLNVKKMILMSLVRLIHHPEASVRQIAQEILLGLAKVPGDHSQQILYQECVPQKFGPPQPKVEVSTKLLQAAQRMMEFEQIQNSTLVKKPEPLAQLGDGIGNLKQTLERMEEIKNTLALYVAPLGKVTNDTTDTFDLETEVDTFLISDKKILLLLGEAGSGKSTFSRHLGRKLWNSYDYSNNKPIPLYIWLPTIKNPNENLIQQYLIEEGKFSQTQVEDLKKKQSFVFILDGYDEIQNRYRPFYEDNKLDEWNAKVIISCRLEYLASGYKKKFKPPQGSKFFQKLIVASFSRNEIDSYITKYVTNQNPKWSVKDYQNILDHNPNLVDLMSNPFILSISMKVLPDLVNQYKIENKILNITRLALYDQFVKKWFERSKDRLRHHRLNKDEKNAFQNLEEDDFILHGIRFCKDLAVEMHKAQEIVVDYSADADVETDWRAKFFSNESTKMRILRFSSPLSRSGNKYRFIHKSILEYFVARAIYETFTKKVKVNGEVLFKTKNLVHDHGVIRFLVEYTQKPETMPEFNKKLCEFIDSSKSDINSQIAAANAITILVKARVVFSNQDLNDVRISGADLSYGVFDYTQFQRADLSMVNLQGAWLREVNFSHANMTGVEFGEMPSLIIKNPDIHNQGHHDYLSCHFSQDGKFLIGFIKDTITLYNAETFEEIWTLFVKDKCVIEQYREAPISISSDGGLIIFGGQNLWIINNIGENPTFEKFKEYAGKILSVSFSPDGKLVVSGSMDHIVYLWSVKKKKLLYTFKGHTDGVTSVSFSPNGKFIISGSLDNKINLWSVEGKRLLYIFHEHTDGVTSVSFSPNGEHIISGSMDNNINLWSVEEKKLLCTLKGHTDGVTSVSFSPNSELIISGSCDDTINLWSVEEKRLLHTFNGHTHGVTSVSFSPNGEFFASGSYDRHIRLWSVKDKEKFSHRFEQISVKEPCEEWIKLQNFEKNNVFLPNGKFIVSAKEWCIHLYSRENKDLLHTFEGRKQSGWQFNCVSISPNSEFIAAAENHGVWLFSVKNKELVHVFNGRQREIHCISFSPNGELLASGSMDGTVCLRSINEKRLLNTFDHNLLSRERKGIMCISFSPDGEFVATGGWSCVVTLWSTKNFNQKPWIFDEHTSLIYDVKFSPDGKLIASASGDCTVRIWPVLSGNKSLAVLQGFINPVFNLAWKLTSEGLFLLTDSGKSHQYWHVERDGHELQVKLRWTSYQSALTASNSCIQNVKGLSPINERLLMQRGAIRKAMS